MDERKTLNNFTPNSNKKLQNKQTAPLPGKVLPPITITSTHTPLANTVTSTTAGAGVHNVNMLPRNYRRVPSMPIQYIPSTVNSGYTGAFSNNPYSNRPYNMGYGMNIGGYNPYSSFEQPLTHHQHPVIMAAAENARPAFESIHAVVQSFNAVSMMLESTFTAMNMSFQALLSVADNFTRLRMFLMKLYSTIVSLKLAKWFLMKLFYLLRMLKGHRGSSVEEDIWESLSRTTPEVIHSNDRSWPYVVFTGLLAITPYFMYKLLNSVTPVVDSLPTNNANRVTKKDKRVVFKALCDWSDPNLSSIPLFKDHLYWSYDSYLARVKNGWVYVENSYGNKGYVPLSVLKQLNISPVPQAVRLETSNSLPSIPEQSQ